MPISNLILDFADDLRDPGMMWQLGAIALSAALGWGLARLMRGAFVPNDAQGSVVRFGVASFPRVLAPLLTVLFLSVAKYYLAKVQHVHVNLVRMAMPLVGSMAMIRFTFYLLRRVFARHGPLGAALLMFEKVFQLLVWLAVVLYITGMWPDIFDYLDQTTLPLGRHNISLEAILQAGVSVVVLLVLALWAGTALEERLMNLQGMHSSLRVVLSRTGRAILIVVAVLASLSLVGIDLTVLSVFGGALGVGLGLGLQKIASNYVSGFVILLDRSLTIGDMIAVDKFYGKVTQINTRYTVLQGLDGIESVLPNEMLVSGAVQNYSLSNRKLRIATQVTVGYQSDLDQLLPALERAVAQVPRVLDDPAPSACFVKFGDCGFELDIGLWIGDPENGRMGVLSEVNKVILATLLERKIDIPYPIRELRWPEGSHPVGKPEAAPAA